MQNLELTQDMIDAFTRLHRAGRIELAIKPLDAWFVFCSLQLALRHPHYPAAMRGQVERLTRRLQGILTEIAPGLAELAEAGWNPALDVPYGHGED